MFIPPGLAAVLLVLQELKAVKWRGRFQFSVKLYRTRVSSSRGVWSSSLTAAVVKVSQGSEDEDQRKDKQKLRTERVTPLFSD